MLLSLIFLNNYVHDNDLYRSCDIILPPNYVLITRLYGIRNFALNQNHPADIATTHGADISLSSPLVWTDHEVVFTLKRKEALIIHTLFLFFNLFVANIFSLCFEGSLCGRKVFEVKYCLMQQFEPTKEWRV